MTKNYSPLYIACLAGFTIGTTFADDHHHMHRFPKDVDAFHAVLAPIWHAPQSNERLLSACTKAGEMENMAKGIRSTNASHLIRSVAILQTKCQGDQAAVEIALRDVHDAFHKLIK